MPTATRIRAYRRREIMICAIGYRACGGPTNRIRPARESGKVIQCGRERPRSCCGKDRPPCILGTTTNYVETAALSCPVEQRSPGPAHTRNSEALLRRTAGGGCLHVAGDGYPHERGRSRLHFR